MLFLGRDYPKGYDYFREKLKSAFLKNKDVTHEKEIEMLLARGDYIVKELEGASSSVHVAKIQNTKKTLLQ